jgi:two-component system, NarL family, sensor histidine kinase BarA
MDDVLGKPLSAEKAEEVLKKYLKDSKNVTKKFSNEKKIESPAELAVIGEDADKQMLDLFMESLPDSKLEIETAYQSYNIELLIKAVHKLHGALCYTNTPQLREAIKTMEVSLKNGETGKINKLYKQVKKALVAFEKEYHKL